MTPAQGDILISLMIATIARASEISALLQQTRAQGREPTKEELDGVRAAAAQAQADLEAAIAAMP